MPTDTPPTCGAQYKALVDRLFPLHWAEKDPAIARLWIEHPHDRPGYAEFALGSMNGEASKVALGACQAFLIRPAPDWWQWSIEAMGLICGHYGLLVHVDTAQGEIWGVQPEHQKTLCLALSFPTNSPSWHSIRGQLCGIPVHAIDPAYHLRTTYGVRCEPERREG